MDEGELAARLATMVGAGVLFLGGIVWRDQSRYDDGWLIAIGYFFVVSGAIAIWSNLWGFALPFAALYAWRRRMVGRN